MSEFSELTGKFRLSKDVLQDASNSKVTKRPRDSLVCSQCRRSKLRCDRNQPCGSCVKRNEAHACSFQRPASSVVGDRRNTAEDRLIHLESLVKHLMRNQSSQISSSRFKSSLPARVNESPQELVGPSGMIHDRPDEEARYVGSTHWSAVLDDIHELKLALSSYEDINQVEQPVSPKSTTANHEIIFGLSHTYPLQQIISDYLPSKIEIDRSLAMYFQGETFIVPFIHTYEFQRQYRKFWTSQMNVNPLWLSMLFSICYTIALFKESDSSQSHSSRLHLAAGQCLVLGEYHRPQQYVVEALTLYAHSKNLQSLDPSREVGTILGITLRMAYEMAYHRDPDSFGSFTVFEGEMRRRLWSTCKQLHLMTSFQLGLPSGICLENCDAKSPRNLADSDFDEDTTILPQSRPENEPTRLLWFVVKERLMVGFSKVCRQALSFEEISDAEIMQLDREIRQMHTTIPHILKTRPLSDSIGDAPFFIMTRLYVDFIYLKSLCVLHRRYMVRGNRFSTKTCVEAGKSIVSQLIDVHKEFSPGGQLSTERWMLTNFTINDFLLGVMVLCLVVHTRRKSGPQDSTIDSETELEVLSLLKQSQTILFDIAKNCRDARRVSHAVHLVLRGHETSPNPWMESSQTHRTDKNQPNLDLTMLSLQPQYGDDQGNEESFESLDPFSFMNNDFETIDWSTFTPST